MKSLSEISYEEKSNEEEEEQEEWEVEKILKERTKPKKDKKTGCCIKVKEYLVKWVGFANPTWEPEENLTNCEETLKDFLLSQIMKKLKQEKNNKLLITKRKNSFNSLSDEDKDIETSAVSNSVKVNKSVINNNKENMTNKDNDIGYDIEIGKDSEDKKEEKDEIIVFNGGLDVDNDHQDIKILSIKSMKIPKNKTEGIILNIKYEKDGNTFIETFNTKTEEIPKTYLIQYYEKFICDNFKGSECHNEMNFE